LHILVAVSDAAAIGSAFGAALLGAVVGGVLTVLVTRWVEQQRRHHEDVRERRAALRDVQALARVEAERFLTAKSLVTVSRKRDKWVYPVRPMLLSVSSTDQRLQLARYVSEEAWARITDAETDLTLLLQTIEIVGGEPLNAEERKDLDDYEASFDGVLLVFGLLSRVTELDELDEAHDADEDEQDERP
ncbi:MAG TPA: hypothetical protein VLA89_17805, partial [Gemmatimonadales bacterium]|nr:hypothetical protein [Gemmatimonadales bacterium]